MQPMRRLVKASNRMLRNWRDLQSMLYLLALPVLILFLWRTGLHTLLHFAVYGTVIFLFVSIGTIHHQHAHLRMWRNKYLNRLTDWILCIFQGHPTFVFYAAHNANHHRYQHGEKDVARTYRFGGDTNSLMGYIKHPFQAVVVLYPLFFAWLGRLKNRHPRVFIYCIGQYFVIAFVWFGLCVVDVEKFVLLVLLPQLFALHVLLATNYLQHAHADGNSRLNFARNFSGWVNPFLFNIGLHTAHHLHPRVHWSELTELQKIYQPLVDPRLNAGPLLPYLWRTFVMSIFWRAWRSQSLMQSSKKKEFECRSNSTTFT
jgi:fatty acid desaturase